MSGERALVVGESEWAEAVAAFLRPSGWPIATHVLEPADRAWAETQVGRDLLAEALAPLAAEATVAVDALLWPFERKRALVEVLDGVLPAAAALATWCSAQSTTEIASWVRHPRRVVGYSLLPPLDLVRLVEIAPGLDTAPAAVEAVERLFAAAGHETARVRDDAGLVAARIVCLIINEAAAMVQEGVAAPRDIDTALKLGANYPRGPLEWADLMGIDTVYAVLAGLLAEQQEDRYRPCPLLRKMVLAGRLGRKSGRGFFEYPAG
ncbi:MAG TPA: 3-hydroxyacyl-CoA dehydrogenase family protein [Chloroflexota bacterium]|jgi:3-hydroxybutyryl-CoA dehydrogenase|nr:3-hydroxyacyl-CoA dehydrogenase family protein [Chloroflexota bacterium]